MQIDINKSPYGQSGGIYISGSVSSSIVNGYCFYPLMSCSINIKTSNIESGSSLNGVFTVPIYANITSVTQSSGISLIYYGTPDPIRYL